MFFIKAPKFDKPNELDTESLNKRELKKVHREETKESLKINPPSARKV